MLMSELADTVNLLPDAFMSFAYFGKK